MALSFFSFSAHYDLNTADLASSRIAPKQKEKSSSDILSPPAAPASTLIVASPGIITSFDLIFDPVSTKVVESSQQQQAETLEDESQFSFATSAQDEQEDSSDLTQREEEEASQETLTKEGEAPSRPKSAPKTPRNCLFPLLSFFFPEYRPLCF